MKTASQKHKYSSHFSIICISFFTFLSVIVASRRFGSPDDFCTFASSYFDDGCMGSESPRERDLSISSLNQAESQGRFYQIPMYLIAQLVISHSLITMVVKFTLTLSMCLGFMLASKSIFGIRVSLLSSIFFAAGYNLYGAYNGATALPGWFNLGFTSFFYCIYFSHEFLIHKKNRYLMASLIALIISLLCYEIYLILFVYIIIGMFIFNKKTNIPIQNLKRLSNYFISLLCFYIFCYLLYKYSFPGNYSGFKIGSLNPIVVSETIFKLSLASPLISFYLLPSKLESSGFSSLILIIGTFFMYMVINKTSKARVSDQIPHKFSYQFYIALFIFSLMPNLLLSISERYQIWVDINPMYVNALLSYSVLCILIALILEAINVKSQITSMFLKTFVSIFLISSMMQNISYFSESASLNSKITRLENQILNTSPKDLSNTAKKYNKSVEAFPYRYFEAFRYENRS